MDRVLAARFATVRFGLSVFSSTLSELLSICLTQTLKQFAVFAGSTVSSRPAPVFEIADRFGKWQDRQSISDSCRSDPPREFFTLVIEIISKEDVVYLLVEIQRVKFRTRQAPEIPSYSCRIRAIPFAMSGQCKTVDAAVIFTVYFDYPAKPRMVARLYPASSRSAGTAT